MFKRLARLAFLSIYALLPVRAARAQVPFRQGTEFEVNTYTPNLQTYPKVGVGGDGGFVIAWSSQSQDGQQTDYGVFARRFDSAGVAQALEFQVNTYTIGLQKRPAVAVDADGDFVIVWNSLDQDHSQDGVFGQRYSSSGASLGAEFQVNTRTLYYQNAAAVAAEADGDFVVAWQSAYQDGQQFGIFAQRFDSSGTRQGIEFQVNTFTLLAQRRPSIAIAGNGDFVVAWDSSGGHDGDLYGVFARRFDSAGVAQGAEFQVNAYTVGNQQKPSVATRGNGDFVVAWQSPGDGNDDGIFARRFTSSGVAQAVEFQVNTYTSSYQRQPSAASDSSGRFVITWLSTPNDGSGVGVFGRLFDSGGVPHGPDIQGNSFTADTQSVPSISLGSTGNFVVAWHSAFQDGSSFGVFAQRYQIPPFANLDVDGNGLLNPLTDGLLILRSEFGFTGPVLIDGVVGGGCTRCTAPAIEAYIASQGLIFDIDGNHTLGALTDGLLIVRLLFGFSPPTLTSGVVGPGCTRCDDSSIVTYLHAIDG